MKEYFIGWKETWLTEMWLAEILTPLAFLAMTVICVIRWSDWIAAGGYLTCVVLADTNRMQRRRHQEAHDYLVKMLMECRERERR